MRDLVHDRYISLSAMIGHGRHISSEARTRPLFADRAAALVCLTEYRKRSDAKGRPISTRRGEAAPYLASRASFVVIPRSSRSTLLPDATLCRSYFERSENAAPIRRSSGRPFHVSL